jgi:hypothetical protein
VSPHLATAGEELGFLGASLIVVLLTIVLWRGLRIAAPADLEGADTHPVPWRNSPRLFISPSNHGCRRGCSASGDFTQRRK